VRRRLAGANAAELQLGPPLLAMKKNTYFSYRNTYLSVCFHGSPRKPTSEFCSLCKSNCSCECAR
jgi:hypothetical protein